VIIMLILYRKLVPNLLNSIRWWSIFNQFF
jgi:hypothetical protein